MDVKKLFALACASAVLTACDPTAPFTDTSNKASFDGENACAYASVKNEKIVRWKDGRISRIVLKDKKGTYEKFLGRYGSEIVTVEDNFKIQRPAPDLFELRTTAKSPVANWGFDRIKAQDLHNKNIFGDGVIVAIVDSGLSTTHPQLKDQLAVNPDEIPGNGIDDDGNGLIDDVNGYDFTSSSGKILDTSGHGTHVAGIIAADPSKGSIKGVAPGSKLLIYDFFDANGDGTIFDAIKALRVAANKGAKVINASWGGPSCSSSLKAVINELEEQDVLFVTAAGNGDQFNVGENIDEKPTYPASYSNSNLISVGAMTVDGLTAGFSNFGQKVHIVAPGVSIYSTYPPKTYLSDSGTSMATPFVVGAAALLRSAFPQANAAEIKEAILSSAVDGPYPVLTRGELNVSAAYDHLAQKFQSRLP